MATYNFGTGALYGYRTDAPGTPVRLGVLQDVQLDVKTTMKKLTGEGQYAYAVGVGERNVTVKAKFGQISALMMANLYFGVPIVTGKTAVADRESATVPAATAYTVSPANAATFLTDLGVQYAVSGIQMVKVPTNPSVGQYAVSLAGVYSFAAADASAAVRLSYIYSVAGSGGSLQVNQTLQGIQPVFSAVLRQSFSGPTGTNGQAIQLYACVADDLSLPSKQSDFTVLDFGFTAFANAAGQVINWSYDEVS
jgi:hypothetical protein